MGTFAAIDVGSNAIRLAIVEVATSGLVVRKYDKRFAVRLGADVFAGGGIDAERVGRLVAVFEQIAQQLERLKVTRYRAVATSAMRDAKNSAAVSSLVRRKSGISLEIIGGDEEGRLMRRSLVRALGSVPPGTLLVDLGGGSLELEHADGVDGASLPLGTVRLLQRHPWLGAALGKAGLEKARAVVRDELMRFLPHAAPAPLAIGTGGSLDALARLAPGRQPLPSIDVARLPALIGRIARLTPRERQRQLGLRKDRADVIVPAALMIQALIERFALRAFVVPGTGIRESILQTLVSDSVVDSGAGELARRMVADASGLERRVLLARGLFEQLAAVHGLWGTAWAPLEAAAYLLGCGAAVDAASAARHAAYLAQSYGALQLDRRGRCLAAAVAHAAAGELRQARALTGAGPDSHPTFVLGAILEVAMALAAVAPSDRVEVRLLEQPLVISAGLSSPLPPAASAHLAKALRRRLRVL